MGIERVVFIRPGETDWNRLGRWQGQVQVPLNAYGRQQAQRLANFIRPIGMTALYTSDLRRAMDTATILAKPLGFLPTPDVRLRERAVGAWQGLTKQEVIDWYPDEYAQLQADPEGYRIPDCGESRREVMTRVRACFNDILRQEKGETIGVLSHTTAIRTLLLDLVPGFDPNAHTYSNMSVTTLERIDDNTWRTVMIDDVSHLQGIEALSFSELEDKR